MNRLKKAPFRLKFLGAVWVGAFIYTLLSLTIGVHGKTAYDRLYGEYLRLTDNFTTIQFINAELDNMGVRLGARDNGTPDGIPADPETIRAKAWEIGYGQRGDRLIRIVDKATADDVSMETGEAVTAFYPEGVPDYIVKAVSCFFGLAVLAVFCFQDIFDFTDGLPRRQRRVRIS
ncbi:MAG: hypothetical protein LBE74_03905 [Treponema sp.]|jgi:hypothetical protein|nr:hypothetical protein [Treponema sp.]